MKIIAAQYSKENVPGGKQLYSQGDSEMVQGGWKLVYSGTAAGEP